MDDAVSDPIERARRLLTECGDTKDPATVVARAQAWALVAIAERVEELTRATRKAQENPLAVTAVPFIAPSAGTRNSTKATPATPVVAPIISSVRSSRRQAP